MDKVIDCSCDVGQFANSIKEAGVETVMRYYNDHNSTTLPSKCLTQNEAQTLCAAGLSIGVVFEQVGGATGNISDFSQDKAVANAARAKQLAGEIGQPQGSAIYFAVDHDFVSAADLTTIKTYFETVSSVLEGSFDCGIYGSGTVAQMLLDPNTEHKIVDFVWLTESLGWSGTQAMLKTDQWALAQGLAQTWPGGSFQYDPNQIGENWSQYGQFRV